MNNKNLKSIKALEALVGKQVMYNTNIVAISSYEFVANNVIIHFSSGKKTQCAECDLTQKIAEFLPVTNKDVQVIEPDHIITTDVGQMLRDVIIENIRKVRSDKEYIPQATSIYKQVNSLINLERARMEAYRISKEFEE